MSEALANQELIGRDHIRKPICSVLRKPYTSPVPVPVGQRHKSRCNKVSCMCIIESNRNAITARRWFEIDPCIRSDMRMIASPIFR